MRTVVRVEAHGRHPSVNGDAEGVCAHGNRGVGHDVQISSSPSITIDVESCLSVVDLDDFDSSSMGSCNPVV